jgi:hypothetical protein
MAVPNRIAYLRKKTKTGKTLSTEERKELTAYEATVKKGRPPQRFEASSEVSDGENEQGGVKVESGFPTVEGGGTGDLPRIDAPPPATEGEQPKEEADGKASPKSKPQADAEKDAAVEQLAAVLGGAWGGLLKEVADMVAREGGFSPLASMSKFANDALKSLGAQFGATIDGDFIYSLNAGCMAHLVKKELAKRDVNPDSYAAMVVIGSGAVTGGAYLFHKRKQKKESAHNAPIVQPPTNGASSPSPTAAPAAAPIPPTLSAPTGATGASAFGAD